MQALDDAVAQELAAALPDNVPVYYASADRDDPFPYVVHRSTDSRKGRIGIAGFSGTEARQYEHSIIVVSADPDEAETLRERIVAQLQNKRLTPAGWQSTTPVDWSGEVHDPGDMLPGGALAYFAGDKWTIDIYRARQA